jgi:hypothetical protein
LSFSNRLNFYYCHIFPTKHLLHLSKLWTIYHFMSIQITNVTCIWRCLLWFLTLLCYFYGYHYGMFLLLSTCLHISHSTICAIFVSFPCIILYFWWCYLFSTMWYIYVFFFSVVINLFSHKIVTSLCCCNVDRVIPIMAILRYDCKVALNTIVKK